MTQKHTPTQFRPIITNAPTKTMLAYNKLIGEKPTHGNLQEKITAQNIWANQCRLLLVAIHNEVQS